MAEFYTILCDAICLCLQYEKVIEELSGTVIESEGWQMINNLFDAVP